MINREVVFSKIAQEKIRGITQLFRDRMVFISKEKVHYKTR